MSESSFLPGLQPETPSYPTHSDLRLGDCVEGMKLLPIFEALLSGWKAMGYELVRMHELFDTLKVQNLPRHQLRRRLASSRCHGRTFRR